MKLKFYKDKLTSLKIINVIALTQANYKKQAYDLKEKGLVLFNNLLNSLTEKNDNLESENINMQILFVIIILKLSKIH